MTWTGHKFLAAMGLAGALALGGCAYDDGYGYGGVSVGTGYYAGGGYYDDYGYGPGGYGGWYNGFYYPGSGYYIYDRGGTRHRWDDGQRRYWEGRRQARGYDGRGGNGRPGGWNNGQGRPQWRDGDRGQWQGNRGEGRGDGRGGRGQWQRGDRGGQFAPGAGQGAGNAIAPQVRPQPQQNVNPNPWAGRQQGMRSAPSMREGGRSFNRGGRRGRAD